MKSNWLIRKVIRTESRMESCLILRSYMQWLNGTIGRSYFKIDRLKLVILLNSNDTKCAPRKSLNTNVFYLTCSKSSTTPCSDWVTIKKKVVFRVYDQVHRGIFITILYSWPKSKWTSTNSYLVCRFLFKEIKSAWCLFFSQVMHKNISMSMKSSYDFYTYDSHAIFFIKKDLVLFQEIKTFTR